MKTGTLRISAMILFAASLFALFSSCGGSGNSASVSNTRVLAIVSEPFT